MNDEISNQTIFKNESSEDINTNWYSEVNTVETVVNTLLSPDSVH